MSEARGSAPARSRPGSLGTGHSHLVMVILMFERADKHDPVVLCDQDEALANRTRGGGALGEERALSGARWEGRVVWAHRIGLPGVDPLDPDRHRSKTRLPERGRVVGTARWLVSLARVASSRRRRRYGGARASFPAPARAPPHGPVVQTRHYSHQLSGRHTRSTTQASFLCQPAMSTFIRTLTRDGSFGIDGCKRRPRHRGPLRRNVAGWQREAPETAPRSDST